ncbi:MAG: hypothetical protein S0880_32390 [Actinomycetota bacterium]|nr:hypothetical protein [Actinomycetota bacterium]
MSDATPPPYAVDDPEFLAVQFGQRYQGLTEPLLAAFVEIGWDPMSGPHTTVLSDVQGAKTVERFMPDIDVVLNYVVFDDVRQVMITRVTRGIG